VRAALDEGSALDLAELGGELHRLPPQGLFDIDEQGIYYSRSDGGGGLGDPLLRAPERVLADVQAGLVSASQAERVYGVVLETTQAAVDTAATACRRDEMRAVRLSGTGPSRAPSASAVDGRAPIPVRYDLARRVVECALCGQGLGPIDENWKTRAVENTAPLAALGPLMTSTLFVVRTYCCPGCATLLDAEMTLPTDPPIQVYSPPAQG
jgi:N-methylhydantoinase B